MKFLNGYLNHFLAGPQKKKSVKIFEEYLSESVKSMLMIQTGFLGEITEKSLEEILKVSSRKILIEFLETFGEGIF